MTNYSHKKMYAYMFLYANQAGAAAASNLTVIVDRVQWLAITDQYSMEPKSGSGGLGSMMRLSSRTERCRCTPRMAFLAKRDTRSVVLNRLVETPDAAASSASISSSRRRCSAAFRLRYLLHAACMKQDAQVRHCCE